MVKRSLLLSAGSDIVEVPDEYLDKVSGGHGTKESAHIIDDRDDSDPSNDCIKTNTRDGAGFDQSWNDDYP